MKLQKYWQVLESHLHTVSGTHKYGLNNKIWGDNKIISAQPQVWRWPLNCGAIWRVCLKQQGKSTSQARQR